MNTKTESLSIVVPAYNAAAFLPTALDSILKQSIKPLEILVVDNLSTDRTAEIALAYGAPVRLLSCDRPGPACARNDAVLQAKGIWISFLDADDVWAENTLELYFTAVQANPAIDCVYGGIRNFKEHVNTTGGYFSGEVLPALLPGAMMMRRTAFDGIGQFNEEFELGTVIEWGFRVKEANLQITALPEVVLHRRIHEDNICKRKKEHNQAYPQIVKAALDRRRKASVKP
jgi:glycosyltransferase involved in cell wall biosynthesis